jgi:signal transduction histidine kinase
MQCPRCQHEYLPAQKFCPECGAPLPRLANPRLTASYADIQRSLATALEQQAATAEILRIISDSHTDVQPAFDAICDSAARLCGADLAGVFRVANGQVHEVSSWSRLDPEFQDMMRRTFPRPLDASTYIGRAILERRMVHVADMADPAAPQSATGTQRFGFRGQLSVPMLRGGEPVGGITIVRRQPGLFSDDQIQLLTIFANQAVIALENVRLFAETREALEQQTVTSDILRVLASSPTDLRPVLDAVVQDASRLCGATNVSLYQVEGGLMRKVAEHGPPLTALSVGETRPISRTYVSGRAIVDRTIIHLPDHQSAEAAREYPDARRDTGIRTTIGVPLLREGVAIGAFTAYRTESRPFAEREISLLRIFADQAVIAIENVRLFKELENANRELAAASHHKSEFLANMSHELRTPLNAIIGFSEVLSERMFGDLTDKQAEYLKDIYASGHHLLSLINDILDLSKIEAGRMELDLTDFDLPMVIDNALMLVRERAGRRSLTVHTAVDARLGQVRADERKIRQVVLNLLSNAIKFTPEGGRVEVRAEPRDGSVEVSVSDTGVGIAPEDQEAVFEEFRQVGPAEKKVEGTGLGLALSRKFIELHGGRIWVTSQVGTGSTFTFALPVRRGE